MGLTYDLGGITLHPHHHEPKFKSHPVIFPLRNKNKNMTLVSLKNLKKNKTLINP